LALRSYLEGAVFAEVYGGGAPVVLALHGWGRRGSDFGAALEGLSALAPDLPGFGASPAPGEAMGAHGYADIIAGMLDGFDEPPVLIGHSFGGRVAVCLAGRFPDRVGALVLTGVPLLRLRSGRPPSRGYRIVRRLHDAGLISDERLERLKKKHGSADYRAADGVMRDVLVKVVNETYEDELSSISSPVRLLWGAEDREVPVSVAEAAEALLADATLEVIPGVGHMVPLQAPEELRRAVDEALG